MPNQTGNLNGELKRDLDKQMLIVQEQQAQATRIIRVGLTTAGLVLTLVSISASSGILSIPSLPELGGTQFIGSVIIWFVGLVIVILLTFVFLRMFAPALAVLSPDAADLSSFRTLMNFPPFSTRKRSAREFAEEELFGESVTLRIGIDADEADALANKADVDSDIQEYHIGCIRGNEALIESNRRHLSEIYRSAATAAFLMLVSLMYGIIAFMTYSAIY